jgi:hypothetical protein
MLQLSRRVMIANEFRPKKHLPVRKSVIARCRPPERRIPCSAADFVQNRGRAASHTCGSAHPLLDLTLANCRL